MTCFTSPRAIRSTRWRKLRPFEVRAAADFFNPLVNGNACTEAKRLHRSQLRLQVVLLSRTTDTAVNDCQLLFGFQTEDFLTSDSSTKMSSGPRKQQRFRRSTIPGQLFKNRDIEFIQLTLQAI